MSTDTNIKTLIFNKLTQEQYNNADRVPTEFYLTPDTSIDSSEKGAANGVASLDTNGKVTSEQIPTATTSTIGGVKPDGNTITVTEDGTISASVSVEGIATKAELQAVDSSKVAKSGDTMTGPLKMSGQNEVRFGTDDNFYYVHQEANSKYLTLYHKNGKGLLINGNLNGIPYYYDGTNYSRLLTTADQESLQTQINSLNTEVSKMLGSPNYNAAVSITLKTTSSGSGRTATYTVPSDGFIWVGEVSSKNVVYINNMLLGGGSSETVSRLIRTLFSVSAGDIIKLTTSDTAGSFSGSFVPNL